MSTFYDFSAKTIDGEEQSLQAYEGKLVLVVNVASKCGFTSQYTGLESLYQTYKEQGFEILGFPCNQFGEQEPGSDAEIKTFCSTTYPVSFPLFSKIEVNGPHAHPVYEFLKEEAPGILGSKAIKWNFTKFLVDRSGNVIKRFASRESAKDIEKVLKVHL